MLGMDSKSAPLIIEKLKKKEEEQYIEKTLAKAREEYHKYLGRVKKYHKLKKQKKQRHPVLESQQTVQKKTKEEKTEKEAKK